MQDDERSQRPQPSTAAATRGALEDALERVAAGQWDAFETVHRQTSLKLLQVCRGILSDEGYAEDALQETYSTVWRRADTFDRMRGTAMSWLIAIARNHAVDRLRTTAKTKADSIEAADDIPDERISALEALVQSEVDQRLKASLDRIDVGNRWLVTAVFFDGYTYAQLAIRAGVPLDTVKSRVRRALIKARSAIDPEGEI
jgi:RNA polymerase sigma factor (sigma-70 family)